MRGLEEVWKLGSKSLGNNCKVVHLYVKLIKKIALRYFFKDFERRCTWELYRFAIFKNTFLFYPLFFPTTLDKTCLDKSWKSSKFKKWLNFSNSKLPPYPHTSMLNLASFCYKKPKTLQTSLISRERGSF